MTEMKKPCACDYEACREVWKRVAPEEDPYPMADNANTQMSAQDSELTLPGAEVDPCCMGSEARELLAVLEGYIEEELEDRRRYLALSRQAPSWARQTLRDMAAWLIAQKEAGKALPHLIRRPTISGARC